MVGGALQGGPGGSWTTQNFGWVGRDAFALIINWPVYSLISKDSVGIHSRRDRNTIEISLKLTFLQQVLRKGRHVVLKWVSGSWVTAIDPLTHDHKITAQ